MEQVTTLSGRMSQKESKDQGDGWLAFPKVSFHLEIFIFPALKEDTQEKRPLFISGLEDPQERGTYNL